MTDVHVEATKSEVTKDGFSKFTRIIHNVRTMSPRAKIFFGVYATFAVTHNAFTNYNAGKVALLKHRRECANGSRYDKSVTEFEAVKNGVYYGSFGRFIDSVIFPYTAISDAMPSVVMYLNPPPPAPVSPSGSAPAPDMSKID